MKHFQQKLKVLMRYAFVLHINLLHDGLFFFYRKLLTGFM